MIQKKLLLVFGLLVGSFSAVFAQNFTQNSPVSEVERLMSVGSRPAFRVDFPQADAKRVEKLWKEFAKDQFDAKLKSQKKTDELVAYGVESSIVSSDPCDIYSLVESTGKASSTLYVWISLGAYFLNSKDNPDRSKNVAAALERFHLAVRRDVIEDDLKNEEEKLKDLEKKLKKLEKEKADRLQDIEDYKAKIKKAEEDIVTNGKNQEAATLEIQNQQKNVEEVRKKLEAIGRQ